MKEIGGYFPYPEQSHEKNHYLEHFCTPDGELRYMMSGRCANYLALMDFRQNKEHPVAYVPLYTCETVIDPFVKAGYELIFYDFKKDMTPVFDEAVLDKIDLISICGYYGFSNYNRDFLKECEKRGICILEDCTHSIFSQDGVYPGCTYIVGSMRKWLGVSCGGYAIKRGGKFQVDTIPPHEQHLQMRKDGMETKTAVFREMDGFTEEDSKNASLLLWDAEMLLRKVYGLHESDSASQEIIENFDFDTLKLRRRENYQYLLEHFPESDCWTPVFPYLDEASVPSHFTLYVKNRTALKEYLNSHNVHATSYWPVGPYVDLTDHENCKYIYDHVLSVPCDQRYTKEDMEHICKTFRNCSSL